MSVVVEIEPEPDSSRLVEKPDLHIIVDGRRVKIGFLAELGKLITTSLRIASVSLHECVDPYGLVSFLTISGFVQKRHEQGKFETRLMTE